jgi:hypothetical protein
MIYTASGKRLKRAIGFTGGLVPFAQEDRTGKPVNAVSSKSINNPVRRKYTRNIPPALGEKHGGQTCG